MDNYYNQIKEQIINNEITKQVKNYSINKSELTTYYNIGKILNEAGKYYGEGIIKKYSIKLTKELSKKYSVTNLKYMRQFYLLIIKGQPVVDQLSWSHYRILITINNIEEFYLENIYSPNKKRNII